MSLMFFFRFFVLLLHLLETLSLQAVHPKASCKHVEYLQHPIPTNLCWGECDEKTGHCNSYIFYCHPGEIENYKEYQQSPAKGEQGPLEDNDVALWILEYNHTWSCENKPSRSDLVHFPSPPFFFSHQKTNKQKTHA